MSESTPLPAPFAPEPMRPVAAGERLDIVDVIRGFAVFGILLVNMQFFNGPQTLRGSGAEWFPGALDQAVRAAIIFFAEGKFYSIFSMLFGLGLAIQMERAVARGAKIGALYFRRLLVLLLFGLIHAFFIWWGDILAIYAMVGMVLLVFRNLKPKTLFIWAIVLFLIPVGILCVMATGLWVAGMIPEVGKVVQPQLDEAAEILAKGVQDSYDAYALGSFGDIMRQRISDVAQSWSNFIIWGPDILAIFLVGLALGKMRLFHDVAGNLPRVRRWLPWLLVFGVVGNLMLVLSLRGGSVLTPAATYATAIWILAAPALGWSYVSILLMLWDRPTWRRLLAPLAPVGRMALTNYLMHSIVFTLVFYSYGFGLWGKVSPAVGLVLTVAMYVVQIPLSAWWLSRFRFGPMEWVWRSLTYLKPQPMRR